MEDAEAKLDELEADLDTARNEYRGLDRYRRILWQEGKYGFELPVRDALVLLGFHQLQPARRAGPLLHGYRGASSSRRNRAPARSAWTPHYRLRERIGDPHLARRAASLRAHRDQRLPPDAPGATRAAVQRCAARRRREHALLRRHRHRPLRRGPRQAGGQGETRRPSPSASWRPRACSRPRWQKPKPRRSRPPPIRGELQ